MPESIICSLRKIAIRATPEERVRQKFLSYATHHLGFPPGGWAIEKELSQMPHLSLKQDIPVRRTDLVYFAPNIHPIHPLYPLLLIECKAVPLTQAVVRQTAGYNHFLGAYFIALVNEIEIKIGTYDKDRNGLRFLKKMPSYSEILGLING